RAESTMQPSRITSDTRSTLAYALAGMAASTVVVVAGGRVGPVRSATVLTHWFGLLSGESYRPGDSPLPGLALVAGLLGLVLLWLSLVRRATPAPPPPHPLPAVPPPPAPGSGRRAGGGRPPPAPGPPLLSSDVYTYAAQGLLVGRGLDPYSVGPSALGSGAASAAVDPTWRSVPSPYGPLATWTQHF